MAISAELGSVLQEIWLNAILEAHYPRFYLAGVDGETYYFGATRAHDQEMLWAEVWSPQADLPPLWMTQIGAEVFKYAQSKSANDTRLRQYLKQAQTKLYAYYEKHGRH